MAQNAELSTLIQNIIEASTLLLQRTACKPEDCARYLGKLPAVFTDFTLLSEYCINNPQSFSDQYQGYYQEVLNLLQTQCHNWSMNASLPIINPDRRFEAVEWTEHPFFQMISQHYLLLEKHLLQLLAKLPVQNQPSVKRVHFLLQQYCHALSPENFLFTNPQLLADTIKHNGLNLLQGLQHFLQDLLQQGTDQWTMPLADEAAFEVGKDLAITPGKVIYQNELIELIQYTPQTETVQAIPLLMIPPWINKYYILDLRPENSLVRWSVEQGIVVFMISWRNPDKSHADLGLSDYLHLGPIAAIDVIRQAMHVPKVSALGFCIGGTLLSILLAYYKAQNKDVIACATLLASLIDFSEPGDLGIFMHEQQVHALEQRMQQQGYLEGEAMASAFNSLRPGDLIWRVFVQRYLFGQPPTAFDLLFWNMDTTNMPAKMHSEYLRTMYLANDLVKPGKVMMNEVPLDVSKIDVPAFFLSTQKDHIALWQSTYRGFDLLKGPKRFVLGGSGHIAGIVNPPSKDKYGYYTNPIYPQQADEWIQNAVHHGGSWWPEWGAWLQEHAGLRIKTSQFLANLEIVPLCEAPGNYVYSKNQG